MRNQYRTKVATTIFALLALGSLTSCGNSSVKEVEVPITTSDAGSVKITSPSETGITDTHGIDGSEITCPVGLPNDSNLLSAMGWTIPTTGPEVVSPQYAEICKFSYLSQSYVVTIAEFTNKESLKKALKAFGDESQGFLYLGLPTSFVAGKIPLENELMVGSMNTDDCGMAGEEVMDENCAAGYAVLRWRGNKVVVISDMFLKDHTPITNIPQVIISTIFNENQ